MNEYCRIALLVFILIILNRLNHFITTKTPPKIASIVNKIGWAILILLLGFVLILLFLTLFT